LAQVQLVKRSTFAATKKPIALLSAIDSCHSQPTRFGQWREHIYFRVARKTFLQNFFIFFAPSSQAPENEPIALLIFYPTRQDSLPPSDPRALE